MFRKRQKFSSVSSSRIFESRLQFDENGNAVIVLRDCCEVLPDKKNFDLETMVKAGVPLKQMNTKLFDYSNTPLPDANSDFSDVEPQNKDNA